MSHQSGRQQERSPNDEPPREGGSDNDDTSRFTGDGAGERGYRGDAPPDTPPGSVPGRSHGAGGGYRQGGEDGTEQPPPRSGYGEQGFGAGESRGGRWGGGDRGGYGGGEPGGLHGTRGGGWAAAGERYEQGRSPRSYGPDGWGARPEQHSPVQRGYERHPSEQHGSGRDSARGGGNRSTHGDAGGSPRRHEHPGGYRPSEAPWRQSEFAGRGEFGDREPGSWNQERGYSTRSTARPERTRDDHWDVPGPHTGRGPRDYRRSESDIRNDVCERLTRHGQLDPTHISVHVENGEVILEGTVDTRASKRSAEDVAETVSGVRDVHNRLRIEEGSYERERMEGRSGR